MSSIARASSVNRSTSWYSTVSILPSSSILKKASSSQPRASMPIFEAKQTINAQLVKYASEKVASVRRLYRTSLPIPHAGGTYPPKPLPHLLGGLLTFESEWSPPLGEPLLEALQKADVHERLDLGCVAAHGTFGCDEFGCFVLKPQGKPATAFLLELIARLQNSATVPMIDVRAYAEWLDR